MDSFSIVTFPATVEESPVRVPAQDVGAQSQIQTYPSLFIIFCFYTGGFVLNSGRINLRSIDAVSTIYVFD